MPGQSYFSWFTVLSMCSITFGNCIPNRICRHHRCCSTAFHKSIHNYSETAGCCYWLIAENTFARSCLPKADPPQLHVLLSQPSSPLSRPRAHISIGRRTVHFPRRSLRTFICKQRGVGRQGWSRQWSWESTNRGACSGTHDERSRSIRSSSMSSHGTIRWAYSSKCLHNSSHQSSRSSSYKWQCGRCSCSSAWLSRNEC
jgi:hypothetical protein